MLRDFDAFGPQAQDCALGHFGRSLPEIESLFGKASPDEQLRYQLAFALWKYARGDLDGQRMARGKQVAELIKSMHEPASALLAALDKLEILYCYGDSAATETALILNIDPAILRTQLGAILATKMPKDKGGILPDTDYAVLMARVGMLYSTATGRKPTVTYVDKDRIFSGNFFRVAELVDIAAAEATGDQIRTNAALGEILGRVFKNIT